MHLFSCHFIDCSDGSTHDDSNIKSGINGLFTWKKKLGFCYEICKNTKLESVKCQTSLKDQSTIEKGQTYFIVQFSNSWWKQKNPKIISQNLDVTIILPFPSITNIL